MVHSMIARTISLFACMAFGTSFAAEPRIISCRVESTEASDAIQALCSEADIAFDLDTLTWTLKRCIGEIENTKELVNKVADIEDLTPTEIVLYEAHFENGTTSILSVALDAKEISQRRMNARGAVLGEVKYKCSELPATQ